MLDSIDTIIAFVLIFLVTSMMITIVVQIVSNAANLRGYNLARGVTVTFQTIAPEMADSAKDLAEKLLAEPLLCDRIGRGSTTAIRPEELFDLLNRIAAGKNDLPNGGAQDPRKTEVCKLLKNLGLNEEALAAGAVLINPAERARAEQAAAQVAGNLLSTLSSAAAALPDGAEKTAVNQAIQTAAARATELAKAAAEDVIRAANTTQAVIDTAYQKFETWFESGQERAQQWFVAHTKLITGFFALVFAFTLRLDAIDIYKLVSTNKTVRDSLVAKANAVESEASKLLADGNGVLNTALGKWQETLPADLKTPPAAGQPASANFDNLKVEVTDTRGSLRQRVAAALENRDVHQAVLKEMEAKTTEPDKAEAGYNEWQKALPADLQKTVQGLKAEPAEPANTFPDRIGALRKKVAAAFDQKAARDAFRNEFDTLVDQTAEAELQKNGSDFNAVKASLNGTGFDLYPPNNQRWPGQEWPDHWFRHLCGMLFSAGLLSLGAPFWYNLLKSMMNLRATVAGTIDKEKKQKAEDDEPSSAPITVSG